MKIDKMATIQVQNICKKMNKKTILKNISFEILQGEIVGFLGLNGAGKSTLLKIIAGYLPPCSGAVFVEEFSMEKDAQKAQKYIGYLPEQNPLYMDMYPKEYLDFVANLHQISQKQKKEQTDFLIKKLDLKKEIHKKIKQLSKGYQQRIGLAASLIHVPKILLLDEPTTGLDPNQILFFRKWLKELSKEKTIFFSTHSLEEVASVCHRVIVLKKGIISEDFYLKNLPENQIISHLQDALKT